MKLLRFPLDQGGLKDLFELFDNGAGLLAYARLDRKIRKLLEKRKQKLGQGTGIYDVVVRSGAGGGAVTTRIETPHYKEALKLLKENGEWVVSKFNRCVDLNMSSQCRLLCVKYRLAIR